MFENLRGGLRALLRRREVEGELDAEMREYIERAAEQKMLAGMPREQALRAARAEFGSTEAVKDYVRDAGWESAIDSVWSDLRFAGRMMRRSPGFTLIIVLTLALGIGANTALFTVVDAVMLKPLPVKNPNELVLFVWDAPNRGVPMAGGYDGSASSDYSLTGNLEGTSFPYRTLELMQADKATFSDVFGFCPIEQLNLMVDGSAEATSGQLVSGSYYRGMGVDAWRGRVLTELDDKAGAPPAAVITWRYWQRRFGGEASAIGKTVTINNVPFTIVGVTPPAFAGALAMVESADVSIPISTDPLVHPQNGEVGKTSLYWLRMMARLQPGVSREQAQARMEPVFRQSAAEAWNAAGDKERVGATTLGERDYPHLMVNPGAQGDEFARRRFRQPLVLLTVVVGLVLLIACINVANLLLARSSARQQEFAMRVALGARRRRLVRQLMTESLLLSAIAGTAGTLLAVWGKDLLIGWAAWIRGGATLQADVDVRVLGFAVAISVLTGILFGVAPAMRAGSTRLAPGVKVQIGHAGRSRAMTGRLLIVAQVAVSLVLLVAAGLFLRTLRNLRRVDTGFKTDNLLLFRVKPEANGYTAATVEALYQRLLETLSTIPGAQHVSLSRHGLLGSSRRAQAIYLAPSNEHNGEIVDVNVVSPGFFDTMEIPVLLGRGIRESDTDASMRVLVVSETFVKDYFPNQNPIGQQVWFGGGGEGNGRPDRRHLTKQPNDRAFQIVGVTRDTKYVDLRTKILPTVYWPAAQEPMPQANFEVKYRGHEASIVTAVRQAVHQVDPRLPIFELRTQAEQADESVGEERMFANLSASMGVLALLLAAVGLYGIMSYNVGRRTAEIGVRMALGARQSDVLGMVLRESLALVAVGLLVGIPIALASARAASSVLEDLLFGIRPTDPLTFGLAVGTLIAVALFAGYFPARRAARTDPMVALRCE